MKKLYRALLLAFAGITNADAQAEREFFVSFAANPITTVVKESNVSARETETYSSMSIGLNHLNPFTANEKIWTSLGGSFSWVRFGDGEGLVRIQFPLSLKYKAKASEHFVLEPYAGLTGTLNLFDYAKGNCGLSGNRISVGWHAGLDFNIHRFVVGIGYEKDFTNYDSFELGNSEGHTRWSSISFKLGCRFD